MSEPSAKPPAERSNASSNAPSDASSDERSAGRRSRRVTITDVARAAGVSIKTVSNVLNDTGAMRPETRDRVKAVMRDLGYRLNVSARAMKAGRTMLIGLALDRFDQPFMPYLADSVIVAARERGYGVITDTYDSRPIEDMIDETYRLGADGWVFFSAHGYRPGSRVLDQPYPVVTLGDYDPEPSGSLADWVTMPNDASMRELAGRLLDGGARTIALVGASLPLSDAPAPLLPERPDGATARRMRGFVEAFRERGIEPDRRYMTTPAAWTRAGGAEGVRRLLASGLPRPDAIMCLNDASALGAIAELQRAGVRVPDEVQVTGFDNVPESEFSTPGLTTVDPQVTDYACRAVDMLIERLEGFDGPARTYVTDYAIVERGSTRI